MYLLANRLTIKTLIRVLACFLVIWWFSFTEKYKSKQMIPTKTSKNKWRKSTGTWDLVSGVRKSVQWFLEIWFMLHPQIFIWCIEKEPQQDWISVWEFYLKYAVHVSLKYTVLSWAPDPVLYIATFMKGYVFRIKHTANHTPIVTKWE